MSDKKAGLAAKPVRPIREWAIKNISTGRLHTITGGSLWLSKRKEIANGVCCIGLDGKPLERPVRVTITVEDGQ